MQMLTVIQFILSLSYMLYHWFQDNLYKVFYFAVEIVLYLSLHACYLDSLIVTHFTQSINIFVSVSAKDNETTLNGSLFVTHIVSHFIQLQRVLQLRGFFILQNIQLCWWTTYMFCVISYKIVFLFCFFTYYIPLAISLHNMPRCLPCIRHASHTLYIYIRSLFLPRN